MFWLFVLLRPRHHHHHHHVHVRRARSKHPRFYNVWYWLSGLALAELLAWWLTGEVLGMWWLLWLAAKGISEIMWRRGHSGPWQSAIDSARPVWPKPTAI